MFSFKSRSESGGRDARSTGYGNISNAGGNATGNSGKRTFTLELSLSTLVTTVVVSMIALGWVFAFGIIVGRGYSPEEKLPTIARMVPQSGDNATETRTDILKPEDLAFMEDLKQKPGTPAQPTRSQNGTQPTGNATLPATTRAAAHAGGNNATRPAVAQAPVQQPAALFDYTIQIVAYKKSSQADTLREKLEGEGLRTRMTTEKGPNGKVRWYRVQVILRGTDADLNEAKARIAALGMKDASVTSRKPAGRNR